jgi:DNA-binding transcriptional ArsR family regulator
MESAQALAALSALAHTDRLSLVRLLVPHGPEGRSAGDIGRALGLSASRLSFHLAQMQAAGLLSSRQDGRRVIYAVDAQTLGRTIAFLLNDCCLDHPEIVACCRKDPAAAGEPQPSAGDHSSPGIRKT